MSKEGIKNLALKMKAMAKQLFQQSSLKQEALDKRKRAAAQAALCFIQEDMILGVGTGSTVDFFIAELAAVKGKIEAVVASSTATAQKIRALGIPLMDLNAVPRLPLYIDGADEVGPQKCLIKGGGGALTREKIIASVAEQFVCIIDQSKRVDLLGEFPIAVEVLPLARSYVARELVKLGGEPVYREGFVTDNGNVILDVYRLKLLDPLELERQINLITGVVENGIFAHRKADLVLIGTSSGIERA